MTDKTRADLPSALDELSRRYPDWRLGQLIAARVGPAPGNENYGAGPNSTSTGVGVLMRVLNLSLPFASWMRNTAMLSVF